ncbi:UDP-N-acetylglucosamine transferase subunit alg14 [Fusarium oxysporum f. sp. albedinis]|nr:UDP-N-acetylglucosamine transferase subunit alg14 [Fusarium oxysporum f. sp. albedinis]
MRRSQVQALAGAIPLPSDSSFCRYIMRYTFVCRKSSSFCLRSRIALQNAFSSNHKAWFRGLVLQDTVRNINISSPKSKPCFGSGTYKVQGKKLSRNGCDKINAQPLLYTAPQPSSKQTCASTSRCLKSTTHMRHRKA